MAEAERTLKDRRELRTFWVIIGVAVACALAGSVAGVSLWVLDPADGSTTEAALGLTAAITGLATGAVFGAAAIYAQIKNLWRFAPMWFRRAAWAILIVAFVTGIAISVAGSLE